MIRAFFLLLLLSPLLYASDNDPLREEKILSVAAAATVFLAAVAVWKRLSITNIREIVIIVLFSSLVILQQFVIDNGSFIFGLKYAVVLSATFVPYWIAHTMSTSAPELKRTVIFGIGLLFLLTVITIPTSYVFGLGEVYGRDGTAIRAFGWLGDSFSPVIVFLVVYYFFQRKFLFAILSLGILLMTGAKTASLMLIAIPGVLIFSRATLRMKVTVVVVSMALLLVLLRSAAPIVANSGDLPGFEYSLNTRLLSIYNGLNYFVSAPWSGVGVNQTLRFVEVDSAELAKGLGIGSYYDVYQIHNAIIRTAAETGVGGLALLLALCYVLLSTAYRQLRAAKNVDDPRERAIVMASSSWVISFVLFYQTTGWFEAGHPQLSWLLLFSTLSSVFCRHRAAKGLPVDKGVRAPARANVGLQSG